MKRQYIVILAIGLLASCQVLEETGTGVLSPGPVAFTASNGDLAETKTLLQADNTISWLPQDEISVFYGDRKHTRFVADGKETAQTMVFKGEWDGYDYKEGDAFWAVYPYREDNAFDGENLTVTLPSEQTALAGSFADDLFVSVARTTDFSLKFYNVCGGIKFCVTEPGVKTVQLEGNGNEPLAGTVQVGLDGSGIPVITKVQNGFETVTLTLPDGALFEVGKWYYMAVLPASLEKGYRITLTKEDGTSSIKKYNKPISVKRAIFGVLENLDSGLSYEIRVPENEIWYTTTNGQILPTDRFYGGVISNTYEQGKGRLVYGHPLTELAYGGFDNNDLLETVMLPESIQVIGTAVFCQCPSLKTIDMPGVKTIEAFAFDSSGLSGTLELPETLEFIGAFSFFRCQSIDKLIIPENVNWIGEGAFLEAGFKTAVIRPLTPPDMEEDWYSLNVRGVLWQNRTIIYVPETSLEAYQTAFGWSRCVGFIATEGKTPDECFYASTDYSRDGEVILLQAATEGKGINLIMMGDGYTDRDLEPGGKYEQRVRLEIEDFFKLEPFKTFRNRFNVYMINCVSKNDVFFTPFGADRLFTYDLSFNSFMERLDVCERYAKKVEMGETEPIYATVLLNRDYDVEAAFCNIIWGPPRYMAFAFSSNRRNAGDADVFSHEMGGHGFARLADEYMGAGLYFPEESRADWDYFVEQYGWGVNIDWHSNPAEVRWRRFLTDSRYSEEGLGVFEGGAVFEFGIYRCSEESVMNGTGPRGSGPSGYSSWFNAPSREAIYKHIMKLSEGPDWIYDYETFVAADAAGREQAAAKYKEWKVAYEDFWSKQDTYNTVGASRGRYARPETPPHRPPVLRFVQDR